jgi:phage shock protein PspC (stress-responsive transcriptional regulator)
VVENHALRGVCYGVGMRYGELIVALLILLIIVAILF